MSKGTFEASLGVVISVILAVAALVLIWYFHEKIFGFFSGVILEGLQNFIKCTLKAIVTFNIAGC